MTFHEDFNEAGEPIEEGAVVDLDPLTGIHPLREDPAVMPYGGIARKDLPKQLMMTGMEFAFAVDPGKSVQVVVDTDQGEVTIEMPWNVACVFRQAFSDVLLSHIPEKGKGKK